MSIIAKPATASLQSSSSLASGLRFYWPLDEGSGSTYRDVSTNGNSGTNARASFDTGGVQPWTTTEWGPSLDMVGRRNALNLSTAIGDAFATWSPVGRTIAMLVKFPAASTTYPTGSLVNGLAALDSDTTMRIVVGGVQVSVTVPAITREVWSVLFVGITASRQRFARFAGVTTTHATVINGGNYGLVGIRSAASDGASFTLAGVAGWDRQLTDAEMVTLEADFFSPVRSDAYRTLIKAHDPVGYWRMEGDWLDSVGSNHGTPVSSPTFTTGILAGGQSGSFVAGSSQYVDLGASFVPGADSFTFEAWVNSGSSTNQLPLSSRSSSAAQGYEFLIGGVAGQISMRLATSDGNYVSSSRSGLGDGAFHHLVGVIDRTLNQARFYADGTQVGAVIPISGTITPAQNLYVARRGSTYYSGQVDEIAVYNRALTATEILAHYNAGITAAVTGNLLLRRRRAS